MSLKNVRSFVAWLGVVLFSTALGCTPQIVPGPGDAGAEGASSGTTDGGSASPTGTLRVLITDKPYPFEYIERADVTITRVEVRRANVTTNGGCQLDSDCDDGLFCNGAETCDSNGLCVDGEPPCAPGEICDGDANTCGLCVGDADCDDGLFCNGDETCGTNGLCVDGEAPCAPGEICDEDANTCGLCADNADCDDGLFCNGAETCGTNGLCADGEAPCAPGEFCDEDADTCGLAAPDPDDDNEPGRPFIVIFEGEKTFNLLDLQNGRTDLLADADIPAGRYTQMRLIVTAGEVTLIDGRVFPLKVPSGAQSGIKLHFIFEVDAGGETQLLLDVDLSRAFKPIPGGRIDDVSSIRNFMFRPSVAMRLIALSSAGSISGTVTDADMTPLGAVSVTAYRNGDEVAGTSADEAGVYRLVGFPAGSYRVEFSADGFADAEVADVVVTTGQTTENVDVILEEAP